MLKRIREINTSVIYTIDYGGVAVIYFYYPLNTIGGAETLLLRMARYFVKYGNSVTILSTEVSNNYITEQLNEICNIVKVNCINDIFKIYRCTEHLEHHRDTFICFFLIDFFQCYNIISQKHLNMDIIIYVIHPYNLLLNGIKRNFIAKWIALETFKGIILDLIQSKRIIFMDNICIENTELFYKLSINNIAIRVLLPMNVFPALSEMRLLNIAMTRIKKKRILAIARTEFPFKGYLVGLIYLFQSIRERFPNVSLLIITTNKSLLKKSVLEYENNKNIKISYKNITILENVPYDSLSEIFLSSYVNIGMGTTILDAANYALPSLVVKSYTYNCSFVNFFHEKPTCIGGMAETTNDCGSYATNSYLDYILNLETPEYIHICNKTFQALQDNYDIDRNVPKILNIAHSVQSVEFSLRQRFFVKCLNFYHILRRMFCYKISP